MQDKLQGNENTPAVTERRACPRLRPTSLMYIDIGTLNGGIVTSLSEGGLAFTAASTLGNGELGNGPLRMRIQFPGIPEAMEASGEIVWTSASGKEARVRFVELAEEARGQIRSWISAQTSINGPWPEVPKVPKMQIPNSPGAKGPGSRFSFAEVASSRVGGEDETEEPEDLPGIARELGELPPLQAQGLRFGDATKLVASAFESPAFAEDPANKTHSPGNKQITQAKPDEKLLRGLFPRIPERRQHSRRQILLFAYAVLGEDNGGLVFSLGEGGLALRAAAALQEHHFPKIRVRFPDSEDWIETSGRLAWKSDSGKEAGIEFVGLPEEARARIREWVSPGEPAPDLGSTKEEIRTTQSPIRELPSIMESEGSSAEPIESPASFEEQPYEDRSFEKRAKIPAPLSAFFKTGIKGVLERTSVRKRVATIQLPRPADHSVKPRIGVARKALAIAAGVALAVGSWMFLQRSALNQASGIIAQNVPYPQPAHEPTQKREIPKTEVGAAGATEVPRAQPGENAATQPGIAKPLVQNVETEPPTPQTSKTAVASSIAGSDRTLKEKPRRQEALARAPRASSAPHGSDRQQHTPSERRQETKAPQITVSASAPASGKELVQNDSRVAKSIQARPSDNKPVQIAPALPVQNKGLNATALSVNANPPPPAVAPPVDLEKAKPLVVSKQPEPPVVARTPVVSVSFDPYPSIRMPKAEGSKKSHQGKSLQMGRLLARVDPVYPEEARQHGLEGTVQVHAIFNREGTVQSVISVSGPSLLVPAAMSAVRQWRYSQTILGGQAMETEEDVTVQFRLANSPSKN